MATTIKIHVADGRDRDAVIDLTPAQAEAVAHFLSNVTYGQIYQHVPHTGDGNKAFSESDRETQTARDGLNLIGYAFDSALCRRDQGSKALASPRRPEGAL